MPKKNPDLEPVQTSAPAEEPKAGAVEIKGVEDQICASGFYCYIGPNIRGLIQTGTIYRGSRNDALKTAAKAIEQYPLVKTLIVSGDELHKARQRVKESGNILNANYQKLARK